MPMHAHSDMESSDAANGPWHGNRTCLSPAWMIFWKSFSAPSSFAMAASPSPLRSGAKSAMILALLEFSVPWALDTACTGAARI